MEHFFSQWIALSKIELNFDSLKELILGEQFLHSCPRDLALFIRERTPASVTEMMKLAAVYTDSRLASGMKDKVVSSPPVVINPTPVPSSDLQLSSPRLVRDPPRCFLCNAIGHKAQQCRAGRPRVNQPSTSGHSDKGVVFAGACLTFPVDILNSEVSSCAKVGDVIACGSITGSGMNLPVVNGVFERSPVKVLRDTGCKGLLVRQDLVNPACLTGETKIMVKVDATRELLPVARCYLELSEFTGYYDVLCVPSMVCDVIVGNIPGVFLRMEDIIPPLVSLPLKRHVFGIPVSLSTKGVVNPLDQVNHFPSQSAPSYAGTESSAKSLVRGQVT